jgi:hypothetical protein
MRLLRVVLSRCVADFARGFGSNPLDVCIFPMLCCRWLREKMSGRGSGGSTPSGITATVHNPITQSKPAINLSVMN